MMSALLRVFYSSIFIWALIAMPAFAGEAGERTIRDLTGTWDIEVINRPNSAFRGTAYVPSGEGPSITAKIITEDRCCNGENYARVQQKSVITVTDGRIDVLSTIEKYLIREEGRPGVTYSPDDFILEWVDDNTLEGRLNGYTSVRWVRGGDVVA